MSFRTATFGEICEFKYGKSLAASSRIPGDAVVYGSNGPVGTHSTPLSDGPTIVIGRKGSVGEVHYCGGPNWAIDTTYFIDATSTDCDLKWLSYALSASRIRQLNKAAAIPGLNRNDAYRESVLVPSLDEQKRIAAILDKADQLRHKRRQAIALLDSLTQSIFLQMFGDPVSNPKRWEWAKLGEIGNLDRGVSKHRPRNDPKLLVGDHPLIQTGDVSNSGGYIRTFNSTYSDFGLSQSKMWPTGTLCITIAANIASTGILTFPACFPDSVVGFSSSTPGMSQYVRVWMSFLKETLERTAPAVAQKNINLAILRELDIPLPSGEILLKFSSAMAQLAAEQERSILQEKISNNLFSSVQQRAFSGQL